MLEQKITSKRISNQGKALWLGILILLIIFPLAGSSQDTQRSISVKYINGTISLDGKLDEPEWQTADEGVDFWQYFPSDATKSQNATKFKLLYNDNTLYIGIRAEVKSDNYVVSSLRRDFSGGSNDNVTLMFDTFNDGTTAFLFGMTPFGVQREVFVSGGGSDLNGFNTSWDQKWQLESQMYDDHYVLEAAIPFSSLKFKDGESEWRVQCYRWDMQTNEQSAWAKVPQNQMLSSLAFMGKMEFEKPLGKSRTPVAIIPYMNALTSKDFIGNSSKNKFTFGGDAKIALGNSMNLDVTVNPDFSNVEVDDIFTNLTRFEVFLPEKRQFFIDNNDLFGNYGSARDAAPFFSRRIGLARDKYGNMVENRILGGARLSGKIGKDWRLGFLNIQTAEDLTNEIASNNNMMFSLQRKMFSRSSLGLFAINRETFKDYDFSNDENKFNRVFGLDYNLASEDNSWTGKFYLHKSLQPNDSKGNLSSQATLTLMKRKFRWIEDFVYVDKDFQSDLGFVPRKGFLKNGNGFSLNFYPNESSKVSMHSPGVMALYYWDPEMDFKKTDHDYKFYYTINFKNQSIFRFDLDNMYTYLKYSYDPTWSGGTPLPNNQGYTYNRYTFSYTSNPAKVFSYVLTSSGGEFYNGNNFSAGGDFSFRIQPWVLFRLNTRYDAIHLPEPYSSANYWLVTPRIDITFTKSIFWSTMVQYSNQRDNLGINSRLQWRFAPLSDLYLVYNDNYFTKEFGPKFRSINLKITYWLNI